MKIEKSKVHWQLGLGEWLYLEQGKEREKNEICSDQGVHEQIHEQEHFLTWDPHHNEILKLQRRAHTMENGEMGNVGTSREGRGEGGSPEVAAGGARGSSH